MTGKRPARSSASGSGGKPVGGSAPDMMAMFRAMMETFAASIAQRPSEIQHVVLVVPSVQPASFARLNKDFSTLGGYSFSGDGSPVDAARWIERCQSVFRRMTLTDVQRQQLASQQLLGSAMSWWSSVRTTIDDDTFTWAQFQERFERQFVPSVVREQMLEDFMHVAQREDETVHNYHARFDDLTRFATDMVPSEAARVRRFVRGLRPGVRRVICTVPQDMDTVIEMALRVEFTFSSSRVGASSTSGTITQQQQQGGRGRGDRFQPYGRGRGIHQRGGRQARGHGRGGRGGPIQQQGRGQPQPQVQQQGAQQQRPIGICWTCGSHEHYQRSCPQRQQQPALAAVPARAFAVVAPPVPLAGPIPGAGGGAGAAEERPVQR